MPVPIITQVAFDGLSSIPYAYTVLKAVSWLALLYLLKLYFGGASNTSERTMHSKVVLMTGGTSGIGASIAHSLASRGAQLVILTHHPLSDPFLQEYILDLRSRTSNNLVTAEHCDLSSLHSIRKFATKWVDNAPPRRLDMLILCANTMLPRGAKVQVTEDGVEATLGLNYLANFHLLSILSPAIRAQPAGRDVRVVLGICGDYVYGQLPDHTPQPVTAASKEATQKLQNQKKRGAPQRETPKAVPFDAYAAHAASQLALLTFGHSLQSHFSSYKRPDLLPTQTTVLLVDPGLTRTPGLRRYLTFGSLWGLLIYLLTWPFWWLVLKSPDRGAQSFLYAAMEEGLTRGGVSTGGSEPINAAQKESVDASAEGRRVYIRNLAYETTDGDLKEFFKDYPVKTTSIPVNPRTNRSMGYAFVDLPSPSAAERAIQNLNGKKFLDRRVNVQLARKPDVIDGSGGLPNLAGEQANEKKAKPRLIKECRVVDVRGEKKREVEDEEIQKRLWQLSEATVEVLEKEGAVRRAEEKREREVREKNEAKENVSDVFNDSSGMGNAEKGRQPNSGKSRKA